MYYGFEWMKLLSKKDGEQLWRGKAVPAGFRAAAGYFQTFRGA
jgi:hypothetical protein